jgi:TPR repeat protein
MKLLLFLIPIFLFSNTFDQTLLNQKNNIEGYIKQKELFDIIEKSKNISAQKETIPELFSFAINGEGQAYTQLGRIYLYGKGVKKDCKQGVFYLFGALSAKNRDKEALKEIALLFKRGLCVKKDIKKYKKYLKKYYSDLN